MTSTQKGTKIGSKVAVSAHKRSEVHSSNPQQGQGYFLASSQRSAAVSLSPSAQRRSEAAHPTTPHSASDYPRSSSPEPGPGFSAAQFSRGTESRPRMEAFRHSSPHRKNQQVQTTPSHAVSSHRNASPLREESARRGGENKPVREVSCRGSLTPDAKSSRRLSFLDQKDNYQSQTFQEEDPPSKVQNPQGIRVPLRISIHPKDEAVQTDPIRRTLTTSEVRSPKSPYYLEQGSSRLTTDHRAVLRKIPTQEPEMGPYSSIPSEPKALHRNINLESSLKLSVLRDLDGRHRVPSHSEPESLCKHPVYAETKPSSKVLMVSQVESNMRSPIRGDTEVSRKVTISPGQSIPSTHRATTRTVSEGPHKSSMFVTPEHVCKEQSQRPAETNYMSPGPTLRYQESSQKPPIHAELELTPRPLPPRSLPKYGPESSWWGLLNPEAEMSQSWPTTPDFEPKPSPPLDPFMSLLEMNSSPFCEDLMFQREKASPPPPPPPKESPSWAPMMEVPKAPKHTCKQPIQRFSAFFLGM